MDKGFTINVYPASEGGYMVDVYEQELSDLVETFVEDYPPEPSDGGHATGDLAQALEMGKSLALGLAGIEDEVCEGCGEPILENQSHTDGRHATCI